MAVVAEVHDGAALDVAVAVGELALGAAAGAAQAAECEARPLKLLAEAHVERHVARVGVHVEPEILALLVLHLPRAPGAAA